jgi:hypothetical protein
MNCAGACARTEFEVKSHVGLVGNELVNEQARLVALEGFIFDKPLSPSDFQSLARPALMKAWQAKRDSADTGRFTHSRCDTSAVV